MLLYFSFKNLHIRRIEILESLRDNGFDVSITDESGLWCEKWWRSKKMKNDRIRKKLIRKIDNLNLTIKQLYTRLESFEKTFVKYVFNTEKSLMWEIDWKLQKGVI